MREVLRSILVLQYYTRVLLSLSRNFTLQKTVREMGVWDLINSATDKLKQNAPDLTPVKDACWTSYGYSCTAVSKINKNAPHLTPVKSVCGTFYDYSCVAVSKIHNAVRVDGLRNLYGYWPDDETRAKIGLFTTKFTQNAADYAIHEGIKSIPGFR